MRRAVVLMLLLIGATLPAEAALEPSLLRLEAAVIEGTPNELPIQLSARLTQADGRPIGSRDIKIYIRTQEFGDRLLPLGTVKSDSGGSATLKYTPTWAGEQQFVARFAGDAEYGPAEGLTVLRIPLARSPFREEAEPLAAIRRWVPIVAAVLVVMVWAVLLRLLFGVLRGLPRGAVEQRVGHDLGTEVGNGE